MNFKNANTGPGIAYYLALALFGSHRSPVDDITTSGQFIVVIDFSNIEIF